jgi:hypothetical protein
MTDIKPLYINGKRDKARRYVLPSGEIISRRQYIKIKEGVSPESKAYARYLAGKAPKGVTAEKYERRLKKKAEKKRKEKVKKEKEVWGSEYHRIPKKRMPTGGERGYYQLQGTYRFYNMKYRYYAESTGYSTLTGKLYPYGSPNYLILRRQAIENAVAKLDGYDWEYVGVIEEAWLLW